MDTSVDNIEKLYKNYEILNDETKEKSEVSEKKSNRNHWLRSTFINSYLALQSSFNC
jgi:hypothetical protein